MKIGWAVGLFSDFAADKKPPEEISNPPATSLEIPRRTPPNTRPAPQEEKTAPTGIPSEAGLAAIKSPITEISYTSPKPGAPPFVEGGSPIKEESTVCIIEIRKLFNSIKAGMRGRIKEILAKNDETVEQDQVLFLIESEQAKRI